MTTQQCIERLAEWIRENVCADLKFQRALADGFFERDDFERELVTPAVYEGAMPRDVAEHRPGFEQPEHIVAPCVVVAPGEAASISSQFGQVEQEIKLYVQVWEPGSVKRGRHGSVEYMPGDGGYRDLTCFVDRIVTALAEAQLPAGIRIVGDVNFSYADFAKAETWPYFPALVSFKVQYQRFLKPQFDI